MTPRVASIALPLFLAAALLAPPTRAELPDFTALVERNTPLVVNITATKPRDGGGDPSELFDDEMLRRILPVPPGHPQMQPPPERTSGGSGFIISSDGYLLTNHHVVEGATEVRVRLHDRREFDAKVIGSDRLSDVALLKIDASGLPSATLGKSGALKPGQWVVAIGSPFSLDYSVTAGIVSAVGRSLNADQRYVPFIQTDVAINRGNSGGPLFNLAGEVVGINSQIFSTTGGSIGLSFAIPIETAKSVADQLRTRGKVSRGVIGVQIQAIARDEAEALGLPRIGGALVGQVQPGSAAEKAGVKVGDVILSFNDIEVRDSSDLPPLVGATAPGTRATIEVFRDGRTLDLPVVVAELDDSVAAAAGSAPAAPASRDALGLVVRDLSADEREAAGLGEEGVVVEQVQGTAARRAGLRRGDIVLMVGRQRVASAAEFGERAAAVPAGQAVMLLVRRGDATSFIAVRPRAED